MQRKTKESTKEITKTILTILAVGGIITAAGVLSGGARVDTLAHGYIHYSARRVRETIKRLRMQQLIEYDDKDERTPLRLTTKGLIRMKRIRLWDAFSAPKRWDHLWRVVIFDIPEKKRVRKYVQKELMRVGFYQLQKSVYVRPHDCAAAIELLKKEFRIRKHLLLIVAPTLGHWEQEVRRYFFNRSP